MKELSPSFSRKKQISTPTEIIPSSFLSKHPLDYASCINNTIVPDKWCLDNQQVPRYVGNEAWPPRKIQHYTHEGYEKCLADKTVVMIGDSRVRYQFMNLAAFLKKKEFMKCDDYTSSIDNNIVPDLEQCSLIRENQIWNKWYQQTTEKIADQDQQSSLCDCFRMQQEFSPETTFENRFIKRSTTFGEVNLIYLQNFANHIKLNKQYPPFSPFFSTQDRCKPSECGIGNRTDAFDGDVNATMWHILPKLNATHAFINLGWEHLFNLTKQSELSCNIRDFEQHHPHIKIYLLSHPHSLDSESSMFEPSQLKCDCDVLDRTVVTQGISEESNWYWDDLHVLSILNEEFNHQLVEKICPFVASI